MIKTNFVFLDDGRWLMVYSPRKGGLNIPDNVAIANCMQDRVPIAVIVQVTTKADRKFGSTYRVLGLGLVTDYNSPQDVFEIQSIDWDFLENM